MKRARSIGVLTAAVAIGLTASAVARFAMAQGGAIAGHDRLADEGPMPSLSGATAWINAPPLTSQSLKGKVVLIDFWTYSCINCLRTLPYVKAWASKYRNAGLVVIGVHTPEFAFEKDLANIHDAVRRLGIAYPVAVDNHYALWQGFANAYWPADYLIDARGHIRAHHFGEGDYAATETEIQRLLAEAHAPGRAAAVPNGTVAVNGRGIEAAGSGEQQSGETYIGYARAERSVSRPAVVRDRPETYNAHPAATDQWGLSGRWTVGAEHATLDAPGGSIAYRFLARDLHLVLGPGAARRPVRFRVTLDGKAPGADHGTDTDAQGYGTVDRQRLYQLIRAQGPVRARDFTIMFLDPGVDAYSFTFG